MPIFYVKIHSDGKSAKATDLISSKGSFEKPFLPKPAISRNPLDYSTLIESTRPG